MYTEECWCPLAAGCKNEKAKLGFSQMVSIFISSNLISFKTANNDTHFSFFSNSLSTVLANQPPIMIPNSYFICANWAISVTDTELICLEFNHQKQTRNTDFHFQDVINSDASLPPSLKPPSRLQRLQNSFFFLKQDAASHRS